MSRHPTTGEPWSDARLDAAFATRSPMTPTPTDLLELTIGRVRTAGRPEPAWRRLLPAAAVVILVVGVGGWSMIASSQQTIRTSSFAPGSADPQTAAASASFASTTAVASPAVALGLRVLFVEEAIGIRDVGVDDRELAVRGWFQPTPPIPCPAPTTWPVSPVEPNCPDQWVVLMAENLSITTGEPKGFTGALPTGAFFQLDLDDLDIAWQPALPALGPAPPIELVVIGHFDDRRSFACPDAVEQACRDRFVVDRVESVDGAEQATSVVLEVATPSSTAEEVRAVIADAAPGTQILSMALVDGASGIGRIEPALGTGQGGFIDQAATWVVRVLRDEQVTTLLVVDGTDAISEMTPDNVPVRISGSVPTPSIRTPTDAYDFAFSLRSEVAAGRPPAQVAVVDLSGRVTDAREALPEDPRFIDILGPDRVVFRPDPRLRGRFHVVWVGGVCDGSMVVSIDAAFASILVDGGYQPGCDAMGIERHIVLDVDGELDPAVVETRYTETRAPAS